MYTRFRLRRILPIALLCTTLITGCAKVKFVNIDEFNQPVTIAPPITETASPVTGFAIVTGGGISAGGGKIVFSSISETAGSAIQTGPGVLVDSGIQALLFE